MGRSFFFFDLFEAPEIVRWGTFLISTKSSFAFAWSGLLAVQIVLFLMAEG
jgi:hypothetical protein